MLAIRGSGLAAIPNESARAGTRRSSPVFRSRSFHSRIRAWRMPSSCQRTGGPEVFPLELWKMQPTTTTNV